MKPIHPFQGKRFAKLRDIERISQAVLDAWTTLWALPELQERFPPDLIARLDEIDEALRLAAGPQRDELLRRQRLLLEHLTTRRNS